MYMYYIYIYIYIYIPELNRKFNFLKRKCLINTETFNSLKESIKKKVLKVLNIEQLKQNFYVNKYCKFYIRYHCGPDS